MKRIYQKSTLGALILSLGIYCCPPVTQASSSGNEYLDMDIAQLMQVTITSVAKKPQNLSDAAAAVYVITQDDIHRAGVTSIPEALRMAPGLQVARINASKWAITSRGFSGNFANKLLVMIDGRTVYFPSYSGVYWDAQDTLLDDVDRIEVIRGPGATIWGANAVNGVINIITKKACNTQGGLVSLGTGSHDRMTGGMRYGAPLGESAHGRAYLSYHEQNSFELQHNGADGFDDWDSLRGGFRLDGEHGSNNSWTLQGDAYTNQGNQIITPFWMQDYPYMATKYADFDVSGWNILGRWQKKLSTTSSWTLQAYYDYTNRDEALVKQIHKTFDLDMQYQTQIGKFNNLVMGFGYRAVDADFKTTFQVSIHPDQRSEDLYSGFIQDEIMLMPDRLWLTLGAKWEHNDFTGHEIQPSARLLWKATDTQTAWAAVSRAVRTPSQFEESGDIALAVVPTSATTPPMVVSLVGNKEYDSEELIAYEAGYRWLPLANLSLDLALFYNDYHNLQTTDFVPSSLQSQLTFTNHMHGSTHGLELAADWKPLNWLKLQLGYTYINFDLNVDSNSHSVNLDDITEKTSPEHQVSLQTTININQGLKLNLWTRYVSALKAAKKLKPADDQQVDEYLTMDANLIWNATPNLELMLVGRNLLDSSHLEYVSEFATPQTEIERSVYAKLTYHF